MLRAILWGAAIVAVASGVTIWGAAKVGADSERRIGKTSKDRKEPTLAD